MKNICAALILLFFSNYIFGQIGYEYDGIPTYHGGSEQMSSLSKIEDIYFKTQDFISANLPNDFIRATFKVYDSIEFNLEYTINKRGHVVPKKVKVNSSADFFNLKIQEILSTLPMFRPAQIRLNNQTLRKNYTINFTPEFYINENYNLIPIYRFSLDGTSIHINPKEKVYLSLAEKLDYTFGKSDFIKVINAVYFSTNDRLKIVDIRAFSEHKIFTNKVVQFAKNLNLIKPEIFKTLQANKNYSLQVDFLIFKDETSFKNALDKNKPIVIPDTPAIFPGCEKMKDNEALKKCFAEKIKHFIIRNFKTKNFKNSKLSGTLRINVIFKIDKQGHIIEVKSRAPHPLLEMEATRVILSLPKMSKPALFNNTPLNSSYSLPIIFGVEKDGTFSEPKIHYNNGFRNLHRNRN